MGLTTVARSNHGDGRFDSVTTRRAGTHWSTA